MKKVVTWIADDETEFETEQECWRYEHRLDGVKDSVIFLDDEFRPIEFDLANIYELFQYIIIRDAEKAPAVFEELHSYEWCFVRPDGYTDGDVLKWDGDEEDYIDLKKTLLELAEEVRSIERAVESCG